VMTKGKEINKVKDNEQETAEAAARHKRASQMEDRKSEVTGNV
jgi:hypothetical protein